MEELKPKPKSQSIGRTIIHLSIVVLFPLMISGCKIIAFTEPLTFSLDLLDIEEVLVPERAYTNEKFSITVKGYLPDASWTFDHFELTVQDLDMTVKPVGKQDLEEEERDVLAQSRLPFERELTYTATDSGTLSILVIGRNKTIETEVIIVGDD